MEMDDEFDDADLSAAIALSMQADGDRDTAPAGTTNPPCAPAQSAQAQAAAPLASGDFDCTAFCKLMFDGAITTQNDKERWIHERITTTFLQTNGDVPKASVPTNPCVDEVKTQPTPLEIFTGSGIEETGDEVEMTTPMQLWGLTQSHGGPCGVLAALQAEMIRLLLFGRRENKVGGRSLDFPFSPSSVKPKIAPITPDEVNEAMAMAVGMVLARAAITSCVSKDVANVLPDQVRLVLPETRTNGASPGWIDAMLNGTIPQSTDLGLKIHVIPSGIPDDFSNGMSPAKRPRNKEDDGQKLSQTQQKIVDLASLTADYLLGSNTKISSDSAIPLETLQDQGGIMCLVMSLVETRGINRIRGDMDDPNSTITAQFGHSSQELINLTLTGQAVSNTFDNSMNLSEDLHCHGIQSRPAIGYLSMLEALRYCEVGGYYKSPLFPIWVIGSTSHFSVLFGDGRCLEESKSDLLLEQCRRAFMKIEGGGGEAGFIPLEKLGDVLDELDLKIGDAAVQTLQAYLDIGAGIILWDKFWKAVSRLMTGSSVQAIVSSDDDEPPPLFLCNGDVDNSIADNELAAGDKKPASTSTMESDEALARKLAEEMGSVLSQEPNQPKSDEELARELQEQFNRESGVTTIGTRSTGADADTQVAQMDVDEMSSQLPSLSSSRASTPPPPLEPASPKTVRFSDNKVVIYADNSLPHCSTQRLDFEKHGDSFPIYHYNGLSGGKLTPLRLTRLSATEAVGATVALSSKGGGHGGDLEDVIRTKWPSSAMNWFGQKPPSID